MYCDIKLRIIDSSSDKHSGIGPGLVQLLEEIQKTGKVSLAATKMDMSPSKCWKILKAFEQGTGKKIISSETGGVGGGKTTLTEYAETVIQVFRQIEKTADNAANQELKKLNLL